MSSSLFLNLLTNSSFTLIAVLLLNFYNLHSCFPISTNRLSNQLPILYSSFLFRLPFPVLPVWLINPYISSTSYPSIFINLKVCIVCSMQILQILWACPYLPILHPFCVGHLTCLHMWQLEFARVFGGLVLSFLHSLRPH